MKRPILILLALSLLVLVCACTPQNGDTQNTSTQSINRTVSDIIPTPETVKCTIEGNVLTYIDTSGSKVQTVVYTYNAAGQLVSKSYKAVCQNESEAKSIYDSIVAMNKYATEIMYDNIKIEGKTISYDYTDFGMKLDKAFTISQMKEQLETGYIKQSGA